MSRGYLSSCVGALVFTMLAAGAASSDEAVKIGLILPMTGQQASTGKQIDAAVRVFTKQNEVQVAGT